MATKKIGATMDAWPPQLCTPLCPKPLCPRKGKHSEIILVLARCANLPGQEKEFEECLERYKRQTWLHKDCVPDKMESLRYPLVHWTCILGKHVALEMLVDAVFDLGLPVKNVQSNQMETALFSMARHLRLGTNPKLLHTQVAYIFGNVFDVFISHAAYVIRWQQDESGDTIFHFCCKRLDSNPMAKLYLQEMLQRIQVHRPDLSHQDKVKMLGVQNKKGNNMIHELVDIAGCTGIFKFFSENMERVFDELSKVKNLANKTPRQLAVEKKSLELLRALGAPEVVLNSVVNAVGGPQAMRGTLNSRRPAQRTRSEPQGSTSMPGRSATAGSPPSSTAQCARAMDGKGLKENSGRRKDSRETSLSKRPERKNETMLSEKTARGNEDISGVDMMDDSEGQSVEDSNVSTTDAKERTFADVNGEDSCVDFANAVQGMMGKQAAGKGTGGNPASVSSTQSKSNKARKSAGGGASVLKRMSLATASPHGVGAAFDNLAEVSSSDQTTIMHDKTQKRPGSQQSVAKNRSKRRRVDDLSDDLSDSDEDDFNFELNDDSDDSLDSTAEEEAAGLSTDPREMHIGHTPFCTPTCNVQHHSLLLSLLRCSNHTSSRTSNITAFLEKLPQFEHLNDDIPDPVHEFRFPLIHWACVLGKYRLLESLPLTEELDFAVKSKETGETALHRTLLYLDESCTKADMRQSSKRTMQVFSEVLTALTNRKAAIMACTNGEGDSPFHVLAKAIVDCTGRSIRLTCLEGYFDTMLAKLKQLEQRFKLKPGSVEQILTMVNSEQETFLHILACREGVGHILIKKLLRQLDSPILQILKTIPNMKGKTASDIARELGSLDMAQRLRPLPQEMPTVAGCEPVQVKMEPIDNVELANQEPGENMMSSLFDYVDLPNAENPVEPHLEDNQPQVNELALVTSSEGTGPGSSPEKEAVPTTSSDYEAAGSPEVKHEEGCKHYDLVVGIMNSYHPDVMKRNVLETLHRGLKETFDQGNTTLQEKRVGLEKAKRVCEELTQTKEALLGQLEEVKKKMAKASQERSAWLKEVLEKEAQHANHERQLRKCEDALMQLQNSQ